jgi:hypothetical protein
MTSKNLKSAIWLILAVSATALAAGGPPPGKGGGGGETTAAQNLSVPAILVGSLGTLVCGDYAVPSLLKPPTGTPRTGYELPGYYWVQKVHIWQAQCFKAGEASVYGAWGDNLTGDASLKAGSPIRVELVLTNTTDFSATLPSMQGYNVSKLQPSMLDRLSAYGHLAAGNEVDGWDDIPVDFDDALWVVHDAGMQLSVQNLATGAFVVPLQPIAPEINATGKVVYGYNLRVTAAGNYRIRFNTTPAVTITDVDAGDFDASNAYLDIVVGAGGGGGKKGGGKP